MRLLLAACMLVLPSLAAGLAVSDSTVYVHLTLIGHMLGAGVRQDLTGHKWLEFGLSGGIACRPSFALHLGYLRTFGSTDQNHLGVSIGWDQLFARETDAHWRSV